MQTVIAFAAACEFRTASSQLKQFLLSIFRTWLQSRINEKANKVLRDSDRKKNASKVALFVCRFPFDAHARVVAMQFARPLRVELCAPKHTKIEQMRNGRPPLA